MAKYRKTTPEAQPHSPMTEQVHRLNRLAGQVSGIARMIEEGRALSDVLIQLKAAHSGLDAVREKLIVLALRSGIEGALLSTDKDEMKRRLERLFGIATESDRDF